MNLSIVIPCYNEALNVETLRARLMPVVQELRGARSVELVFVDDGSTDGTAALLEQAFAGEQDIQIISYAPNRGLGGALRAGCAAAGGELILTTDSDCTYAYEEIPGLLKQLTPDVDIVTASPYHRDGGVENVPRYRLFFSQGASLCYRLLVSPRIHTYTSLFRVYRRSALAQISWQADGFLAVAEMLVVGMLRGLRVAEYPTVLRVRRYGQSKARVLQITRSHLRFMARVVAWRLRGSVGTDVVPSS
jgi:dolichol-phosphate mannosyltransferase